MKNSTLKLSLLGIAAFLLPSLSFALSNECSGRGYASVSVRKFTNYAPSAGGINGRCGTSASGFNACAFSLDDHLENQTPAVMAASPQKGDYADMYCGIYVSTDIAKEFQKSGCVKVFVGDHYASYIRGSLDIVTNKAQGRVPAQVNQRRSRELTPVGRILKTCPKAKRRELQIRGDAMRPVAFIATVRDASA
jgi:hypothetical protein